MFKNDKREGKGTLTKVGYFYEGEWSNGLKHGLGTETTSNNEIYEGEFKNDLRHGTGKCTYFNGDIYEGGWRKGLKHGKGVLEEDS